MSKILNETKSRFTGKKLLILGSNAGAADMVTYARENGAYTIVADYYIPEKSEAKRAADESVLISTADTAALSKLITDRHIDGILAGISEFNLLKAMELSDKHHLRFYCNKAQWECIAHKNQFRKLCMQNNVPCPKTYFTGNRINGEDLQHFVYPLIIKPVDCSASLGVHICEDEKKLQVSFDDALEKSESGLVIIEEFVRGDEFTAHYTICNGKAALSCIDNRYPVAVHEGKVTTIPAARIYPSIYIDSYIEKVNPAMLRLCESLGIQNGVLFIQGIHDTDSGGFWIFEGGLRSAAEMPNRLLFKTNGINYMNLLVDHILLGEGMLEQLKEDPYMNGKCCGIISFIARHGTVGSITGLKESVEALPGVIGFESRYPVGSVIPDTDTLRQIMLRFVMVCDSREQMAEDIAYLNEHVTVLDDEGKDMVIRLNPKQVLSEFGKNMR